MGTDIPYDTHQESNDTTILFGHHIVARKPFEVRVERPSSLTLGIDYFNVFLPITMIRSQLMNRAVL